LAARGQNVSVAVVSTRAVPSRSPSSAGASNYLKEAAATPLPGDLQSTVTVGPRGLCRISRAPPGDHTDTQQISDRDGTNLEEGLRPPPRVMLQNFANRLLMITDGNETAATCSPRGGRPGRGGIPIRVASDQTSR